MSERNDVSNIYWDQRMGPWSDIHAEAQESRQRLVSEGATDETIRELVEGHEALLYSGRQEAPADQA